MEFLSGTRFIKSYARVAKSSIYFFFAFFLMLLFLTYEVELIRNYSRWSFLSTYTFINTSNPVHCIKFSLFIITCQSKPNMPHHTNTMSFPPTTCLMLTDYMSDALINTEYSRMKDFTGNTTSMTPLKGTPSGSRTRSKTSTAAKRELIKTVLTNEMLQHMDSTQTELITLLKLFIDKTSQNKPPVLKDETTATDDCS